MTLTPAEMRNLTVVERLQMETPMNCPWCDTALEEFQITLDETVLIRTWWWCDPCRATFRSTIEVQQADFRAKGII